MISDKAIIDKNSKVNSSVEVGPFSIIGKEVKIGSNVKILSHVVINGDTSISDDCEIYSLSPKLASRQKKLEKHFIGCVY